MKKLPVRQLPEEGDMTEVSDGEDNVLLCRVEGQLHAISNICSHARVRLSLGKLHGTTVTCGLHGARFDVRTGRCLTGPPKLDLPRYDISRESDGIFIIVVDS